MAMLWVLNLSDGEHSLLDVAERSGLPFDTVAAAADALHERRADQGMTPMTTEGEKATTGDRPGPPSGPSSAGCPGDWPTRRPPA